MTENHCLKRSFWPILLLLLLPFLSCSGEAAPASQATPPNILKISEHRLVPSAATYPPMVTGTVANTSSQTVSYAEIGVRFMDGDRNTLEQVQGDVYNIKPGARKAFNIAFTGPPVKARLITGYAVEIRRIEIAEEE